MFEVIAQLLKEQGGYFFFVTLITRLITLIITIQSVNTSIVVNIIPPFLLEGNKKEDISSPPKSRDYVGRGCTAKPF